MDFYEGYTWHGDYPDGIAGWCNENGFYIEGTDPDENGVCIFTLRKFIPLEETIEQTKERYANMAQEALDTFAKTKGYDNIMSACSYAVSPDIQFAKEATYCILLRDATWHACYNILDSNQLPNEEEFLAMLPTATAKWPNEE